MISEDINNQGMIKAWAAVCMDPWDVIVCQTKEDAEEQAGLKGEAYQVKYGSYRPGTSDFVWFD